MSRVLALDYGSARCGCAVSDPTGTLATPLAVVENPRTKRGTAALVALVAELEPDMVVVGLPLTLAGEEGAQAEETKQFAQYLRRRIHVPVDLHDERLTTRMADRTGGAAPSDSVAAAHLLESYLAMHTEVIS